MCVCTRQAYIFCNLVPLYHPCIPLVGRGRVFCASRPALGGRRPTVGLAGGRVRRGANNNKSRGLRFPATAFAAASHYILSELVFCVANDHVPTISDFLDTTLLLLSLCIILLSSLHHHDCLHHRHLCHHHTYIIYPTYQLLILYINCASANYHVSHKYNVIIIVIIIGH